jgi:two-component system, NtrC family, sensor kinase
MAGVVRLRESFRREAAITLACTGAAALLITGFAALEIADTYRDVIRAGRTRGTNLALLLEEQTRRTVQAIDFSLQTIADTLQEVPNTAKHDPALTARMRSRLKELPYVRALFVIGSDGFLIQDTDSDTPNVSLADRDYFLVHKNDPGSDGGLYIGQPLRSRSLGAPWFLSISRRITLPTGRFYGVAVAALEPKYFARFYGDISVGNDGSLALVHESGTMIARYGMHDRSQRARARAAEPGCECPRCERAAQPHRDRFRQYSAPRHRSRAMAGPQPGGPCFVSGQGPWCRHVSGRGAPCL